MMRLWMDGRESLCGNYIQFGLCRAADPITVWPAQATSESGGLVCVRSPSAAFNTAVSAAELFCTRSQDAIIWREYARPKK
jgi:hypothetical protein